ncbi:type II secretion system protein GspC [Shewanella avicenniae]|uniref:Type II secretion system protein GspC n=1 Tax=Shewanella avicenniae TaxID=2814294 RepID=A0ABX7QS42_9GAMM|nr:type II secretion system protein GspC [Shewanella avicenniae]QSX33518.1 type II secretion system protein GspC [Shewanella avicenniae]
MDLLDKAIAQASRVPARQASNLVFWLLLILALYLAAQVTWKAIPASPTATQWQPSPVSVTQGSVIDIATIKNLGLFGKADAAATQRANQAPVLITDAPKTSLSILLTGVVASTAEQRGVAVIQSAGSQETYGLGDKIKGTSASLKEVYADRIIITNNGRYETLMLDGLEFTAGEDANSHLAQAKADVRATPEDAAVLRDEVLANPDKLSDYIAVSPVQQDGELVGYRLNPGKNAAAFSTAGFKANDLAKSINGYDLTDASQALEVMGQLAELTEISVMVEREGQLTEISLSLPQ